MNVAGGAHLCYLEELPEDSARGFDPQAQGVDSLFVVRKHNKVFAYLDACPHYQGETSLPWRKDAYLDESAEFIVCAAHGARFEIDTGLCVRGPCMGQTLVGVPLQIAADGNISIMR